MNEVAQAHGKRARITFRINPDVDAKTHPHISTGLKSNSLAWRTLMPYACTHWQRQCPALKCTASSATSALITELSPYVDALRRLLSLVDDLSAQRHPPAAHSTSVADARSTTRANRWCRWMNLHAVEREIAGRHLICSSNQVVRSLAMRATASRALNSLKPGRRRTLHWSMLR